MGQITRILPIYLRTVVVRDIALKFWARARPRYHEVIKRKLAPKPGAALLFSVI
jgi:hypothetical protein